MSAARTGNRGIVAAKAAVWAVCLFPAARLARGALQGDLTANPIEYITLQTGWWALVLLLASLAITPLRRITGYNPLIRFRRLLGLFAFFYVALHLATYVGLDRFFDFAGIGEDIAKRPYITVGFGAFLLLVPLALTSTRGWIRRLGRRWQLLHRAVYLSAGLAVLHFYWKKSSKSDVGEPLLFAAILGTLLLVRLVYAVRRRRANAVTA